MCGIIGYIGSEQALPILLNGLKRLEPRGYDSRGISIFDPKGGLFFYRKAEEDRWLQENNSYRSELKGFKAFKAAIPADTPGGIGLGHTRWKTHGGKTDANSHPHTTLKKKIFVVHNGEIDNYKVLIERFNLVDELQSQTDSEVIPWVIEKMMEKHNTSFTNAFKYMLRLIEGSYGIAAMHIDTPDTLLVARCGSPVVIGKSFDQDFQGVFIASDQDAIADKVSKVVHLQDNEWAITTKNRIDVFDLMGESLLNKKEELIIDEIYSGKKGYSHYMEKEIYRSSETISRSLRGRIFKTNSQYHVKLGGLELISEQLTNVEECIIVGCGSAYNAGCYIANILEEYTGIRTRAYKSATFTDRNILIKEKTVLIAISQSGTTKDTIDAISKAKKRGITCIGIVNKTGSEISRMTDAGVFNHIGREVSVASTKAVTSQIIIGSLIAIFIGERSGMSARNKQSILEEIIRLESEVDLMLKDTKERIVALLPQYAHYKRGAYIGSNHSTWLADEASLKLREITNYDFFSFEASELKHGNIALVDESYLCIAFALSDTSLTKVRSNIAQVAAAQGKILVISNQSDFDTAVIPYPRDFKIFEPLLANIQAQALAYHFAVANNKRIDKPRNLAKSVTVQ